MSLIMVYILMKEY